MHIKVPQSAWKLPRDYQGHIIISDIDKTYLATEIDSLLGLLKTAFENPERKNNIPGFSILLRALRRGAHEQPAEKPLFFISASPPQMEDAIAAKMELDGIEHNGIIFKNQLDHVRAGRFKKLREQIGYKLLALLHLWEALPRGAQLILFGDDSESDAKIYSLFRDLLSHRVRGPGLVKLLRDMGVFREEALRVAWFVRRFRESSRPVDSIFINLVSGTQPAQYSRLGPQCFPTENTLQAAFVLYHKGLVRNRALVSIGKDLVLHHDFRPADLLRQIQAGARRGLFPMSVVHELWSELAQARVFPQAPQSFLAEGEFSEYHPPTGDLSDADLSLLHLRRRYLE